MQIYYKIGEAYAKAADGSLSILGINKDTYWWDFIGFIDNEVYELISTPIKYILGVAYARLRPELMAYSAMTMFNVDTLSCLRSMLYCLSKRYPAYAEGGDPCGGDNIPNNIARLRWLVEHGESALKLGAAQGKKVYIRLTT